MLYLRKKRLGREESRDSKKRDIEIAREWNLKKKLFKVLVLEQRVVQGQRGICPGGSVVFVDGEREMSTCLCADRSSPVETNKQLEMQAA